MKRLNWQIWLGFLVSVSAFLSYPLIFVRFSVTRDFPWANLVLFAVALALLVFGIRRAFASDRTHPVRSKIAGGVLASLSLVIIGLFVFTAFIMARWLPASRGAPQVGQKAPDFSLADTTGRQVSLSELLSRSDSILGRDGQTPPAPNGVLLIFYRGYW